MKKILIAVAVLVAVGGYFLWSWSGTPTEVTGTSSVPSETTNTAATPPAQTTPASGSGNPPASGGTTASGYKDGTYTGTVASFDYGQVQVAVTISGGKITNVSVPVYPTAGGHTQEVTNIAIPALKQEVIASQSANVDIVSGATQTSEAFNQSLAAALSKAS